MYTYLLILLILPMTVLKFWEHPKGFVAFTHATFTGRYTIFDW